MCESDFFVAWCYGVTGDGEDSLSGEGGDGEDVSDLLGVESGGMMTPDTFWIDGSVLI